MNKNAKSKVYLMMSGGVDSSVAAYLLKQNPHYYIIGVFMKCWSMEKLLEKGFTEDLYACNWEEDLIDAQMVAEKLEIPFEVWDFQDTYADNVIDYMIHEYSIGRTPNPDVMCNSVVKFGEFYKKAMLNGADYVATGHYARIAQDGDSFYIQKALDVKKDQSYFLWKIDSDKLSHTLFPIGDIANKAEVRKIAMINGLLTSDKKDSQGLCFVGKSSLKLMLQSRLGIQLGSIVTKDFEQAKHALKITKKIIEDYKLNEFVTIGYHQGAYLYTIGQRENLNISGGPWYVSKTDIKNNIVEVVHSDNLNTIEVTSFKVTGVNIFDEIQDSKIYNCITRYNQEPIACSVELSNGEYLIHLSKASSVASGQSLVCFDGDRMIFGGIIEQI
jgi:tRNA-uridine 2-sulfurtransferase